MAEEKSHGNMDLSNKTPTLETGSDQLEMLQFSPPSPLESTLRCRTLAEHKFFSELLLQLSDKLKATKDATKDDFHHRVINKCLT